MQLGNLSDLLQEKVITASAPCRVDFGGTLDISTFHYPLRHLDPATVNIALNLRTTAGLHPFKNGLVRISSSGIAQAEFAPFTAPYDHPLGLMFAVADYFGVSGVSIEIDSTSPPQSGLGGSSVAAVALIGAFSKVLMLMGKEALSPKEMALLAHAIEQGVVGANCGIQDQLAAAFGGVNCWEWLAEPGKAPFIRRQLVTEDATQSLNTHLLVAYLGVTHVSKDVNGTWVRRFVSGQDRGQWREIVELTHRFADALAASDMAHAAEAMNRETAIRKAMTPGVLESMGDRLFTLAKAMGCGARFTGAGGGGCLWAMGEVEAIATLRPVWAKALGERGTAGLIDCRVDPQGVI